MTKSTRFIFAALLVILLQACSWKTIPPANVGKILTTSGYNEDVLPPGKYTLWGRDRMITLDTSTNVYTESVTVKMKDKLELTADVKFRARIGGGAQSINAMFNDVQAGEDSHIGFTELCVVYGQMVVRNVAREVLSPYNVDDVHLNYSRLSEELGAALVTALEGTPIEVSDVAIGNIDYPSVVTEAINIAEQRRLQIEAEQAQAEIDQVKRTNDQILAELEYEVEMTRARTIRDANNTISEGLTPPILELRRIEAITAMTENKSAVFLPFESMGTAGASVKMFGSTPVPRE